MPDPAKVAAQVGRGEPMLRRFDNHQRVQHLVMMVTFILLAATGLPLKFADHSASQWWISFWGGIDNTRSIHHVAAFVMIGDCLYHVAYVLYSTIILKRPFPFQMVPSPKDVQDMFQDFKYYLRLSPTRGQYDRFDYRQKFDYWAIFWGMPIIGISGLILLFPVTVTKILPSWSVPVSLVAHSDEALLAVVWILLVHVVFNILSLLEKPIFPLRLPIFHGEMPRERYEKEHPAEYARLEAMAREMNIEAAVAEPAGVKNAGARTRRAYAAEFGSSGDQIPPAKPQP